jgi:hypothetical protein
LCVVHGLATAALAPHRVAVLNVPAALSSLVAGAAFILKARGASSDTLSNTVLAGVIINVGGGAISIAATLTGMWAAKQLKSTTTATDARTGLSAAPLLLAPSARQADNAAETMLHDGDTDWRQVSNPLSNPKRL